MNKISALIALVAATQAAPVSAGVFSFLKRKDNTQGQEQGQSQTRHPSGQVSTDKKSRAEAKVDKSGSIVRMGINTSARVSDDGAVSISRGVILVSSGEGFMRRPPVQVSTPQGDVTVRGSAIVAALPDGSVKMTMLEGTARGALGGKDMALNAGQLMIQRHETRDAVKVDLEALVASSALLDGSQFKLPLPAAPVIQQEVVQQVQALGGNVSLSGGTSTAQVTNAAEVKLLKNAEALNSTQTVSGGTLSLSNSATNASAGLVMYSSVSTLAGGGAPGAPAIGPLNTVTPSLNLGGTPSFIVSGSSLVMSPGSSFSIVDNVGGLPTGVLTFQGGSTVTTISPPPVSQISVGSMSGGVTSGSSFTISSSSLVNTIGGGFLVLTPGITTTGQLTPSTGIGMTSGTLTLSPGTTTSSGSAQLSTPTPTLTVTRGTDVYQLIDWSLPSGVTLSPPTSSAYSNVPFFSNPGDFTHGAVNIINNRVLSDSASTFSSSVSLVRYPSYSTPPPMAPVNNTAPPVVP